MFRDLGIELPVAADAVSSKDPDAASYVGEGYAVSLIGSDVGVVRTTTNPSTIPKGAIIGFTNTYGNYGLRAITHVGVSIGGGSMIDMPTASGNVQNRSISTFPPDPDGEYVYVIPHKLVGNGGNGFDQGTIQNMQAKKEPEFFSAIEQTANNLGMEPLELAAVLAQESSLNISAGNGEFHGLFQASQDVRNKYGVYKGQPAAEQLRALERYVKDRGYRPGMGLEAFYATILVGNADNESSSGVYNPSDRYGTNVLNSLSNFQPGGTKYKEAMQYFGL